MAQVKIQTTKDYTLFERSSDNRPTDLKKHKKLLNSMERYGFLKSFPIVVRRVGNKLIIKDGQHRFVIAASLGLPVHWVEEDVDFDIAVINCASRGWVLRDYAAKFAANGNKAYQEGIDFADDHGIPIGSAFAMLAGTTTFKNVQNQFIAGEFRIKDRMWAEAIAGIYCPLSEMAPALKSATFLLACMAVCRVPGFDPKRLIENAPRCRSKMVAFRHRDDHLAALEEIYNWKRAASNLVPLKLEAVRVMRDRIPTRAVKKKPVAAAS